MDSEDARTGPKLRTQFRDVSYSCTTQKCSGPGARTPEVCVPDTMKVRSPRIVTVNVPSLETDDPVLDQQLLERVAARTGGRYRLLEEAPRLLDALDDPKQERPLDEPEREEIWAGFPQLSLLVALLAAEWILRKRRNLV